MVKSFHLVNNLVKEVLYVVSLRSIGWIVASELGVLVELFGWVIIEMLAGVSIGRIESMIAFN